MHGCHQQISFFSFFFIYKGWKKNNIFMVIKYFKGKDRSTLRWSTEVIQKPFPSTTTRLLISTLVLVPSPIFHSTLHFESGKQFGLSRHSILQCWCSVHGTTLMCPLGKDPNPEKYILIRRSTMVRNTNRKQCVYTINSFHYTGKKLWNNFISYNYKSIFNWKPIISLTY